MPEELRCSKCGVLAEPGSEACDVCGGTRFKRATGPPGPRPGLPIDAALTPPLVAGRVRPPALPIAVDSEAPIHRIPGTVTRKRAGAPARAANSIGAPIRAADIGPMLRGIPLGIALAALLVSGFIHPNAFGGLGIVVRAVIVLPGTILLTGLALAARGKRAFGISLITGAGLAVGCLCIAFGLLLFYDVTVIFWTLISSH